MTYQNPESTVDIIVERNNQILLIERKNKPFRNCWALPGGYLNYGEETLEEAAVRELEEETSLITQVYDIELFGVYSDPKRDPRGHVISHVYEVASVTGNLKANDDALEARFFPKDDLPENLAFDHNKILEDYRIQKQLKGG